MEANTPPPIRPVELAAALGIGKAYASLLLAGKRTLSLAMALKAWRATGHKLGGLEALTDAECDQIDRLTGAVRAAAAPDAPAPTRPIVSMGEGFAG
jgi:hypothetical protein